MATIIDNNNNLSQEQIEELACGASFLQQWLENRTGSLGKPQDGKSKVNRTLKKIDEALIFASNEDCITQLCKALEEGKIHLRPEISKKYSQEEFIEMLKKQIETNPNVSAALGYSWNEMIEEPAIFINVENVDKLKSQKTGVSLASVVAHELTHLSELTSSLTMIALTSSNRKHETDTSSSENSEWLDDSLSYDDIPTEVYARIMEFRLNMGMDPTHIFTLEEIQQLRAICDERRKNAENGELDEHSQETDYKLFDRYSDESMLDLLNRLAYEENSNQIKETLNLGLETETPLRETLLAQRTVHDCQIRLNTQKLRQDTTSQTQPNQSPSNQTTLTPEMIARRNSNQYA